METHLVHSPLVIIEDDVNLRLGGIVEIPDDHSTVGGGGGEDSIDQWTPCDVVVAKVEAFQIRAAQVELLNSPRIARQTVHLEETSPSDDEVSSLSTHVHRIDGTVDAEP